MLYLCCCCCSVASNSLWPHGLQHARPPCPSPTPGVYSKSCPLSGWCHPAISSSVAPFSSCPQSLPASGSFPMSQLFPSGGQSIGVSALASVLPMSIQDWFPLGLTGLISLQSKGLSIIFHDKWSIAMFIHLFIIYGCCFTTKVEPSNSKEVPWPAKPKIFTVCSFIQRVFWSLLRQIPLERHVYTVFL